jgi:hypothetical protein
VPLQSHEANPNPTTEMKESIAQVRTLHADFAFFLDQVAPGRSREKSLALTKLEEAAMWANKAITRVGVE